MKNSDFFGVMERRRNIDHVLKGGNSRLDEIQAAILRVKLKYLDQWNEERRRKARIYTRMLAAFAVVARSRKRRHGMSIISLSFEQRRRNSLQTFLKGKGIETLIHYPIPIHLQKAYRELGYQRGDLPLTEKSSREVLSIPFFPELREEELGEVARQMNNFF